jgi:SulP family sulfate permease
VTSPLSKNIRGDVYGGITAAVIALPLALAFGVASGAGPIAGIYGAIFVGLFAALFGGTPTQISGPTGPMTVVMAATFTQYTSYDPVMGPALAFTVVMMGGLFQILFGVLKLGKYIALVPFPVISGFMTGIGVIIIILQLPAIFGYATPSGGIIASLKALPQFIQSPVNQAMILGAISLVIVSFLPKNINRIIPSPLLALICGTLIFIFLFPEKIATTLGNIPSGFPAIQKPTFETALIIDMIKSAIVLAVLGAIDSLLTSLVADNLTRTHHDSNKELIGQGIGNTFAGIFGGLPGAGATMRTVVNIKAGGQTKISGIIHAVILLIIVLGAGAYAEEIPHAVLAGILIKVGIDIIDWDFLKHLKHVPRTSAFLMFTVLIITVFIDLITAVVVGVVSASLILVNRLSDLQSKSIKIITQPDDEVPLSIEENKILQRANGHILLYHLSGPLSFGAAKDMSKQLATYNKYDVLILDFTAVPLIDYTTSKTIHDMVGDANNTNRTVFMVGMTGQVAILLNKLGILDLVKQEHQENSRLTALQNAAKLIS